MVMQLNVIDGQTEVKQFPSFKGIMIGRVSAELLELILSSWFKLYCHLLHICLCSAIKIVTVLAQFLRILTSCTLLIVY